MGESPKARWFVVVLFGELALASMAWCVAALVLYLVNYGFRTPQNQRETVLLVGAVMMPLLGGFRSHKMISYFLAIIGLWRPTKFRLPELEPSKRIPALIQGLMFLFFASVFVLIWQNEPRFQRQPLIVISMTLSFGIAGISMVCWAISEMLTARRNRTETKLTRTDDQNTASSPTPTSDESPAAATQ